MPSQIDQLRVRFDQMTTPQKREFIDKLKAMPNRSPEHMRFIGECVQKCNAEMSGGFTGNLANGEVNLKAKFNLRIIVRICSIIQCCLFFFPLVRCSDLGDMSGYTLAMEVNPLIFVLLLFPTILVLAAFIGIKTYKAWRNISIAGLTVKLAFMAYIMIEADRNGVRAYISFTVYSWLVVFIYIGLIALTHHYMKNKRYV
jgi:hypothetical protein